MVNRVADPLTQLRDIHLPDPISWWPLAIGWEVLFVLMLVLASLIVLSVRRFYQRGRARREGLRLLRQYEQAYQEGLSSHLVSIQISEILRRVALVYFAREELAGLQGELWITFLNKSAKGVHFSAVRESLLVLPYQPNHSMHLEPLFLCAKMWIKQRRGRCLN